MTTTQTAKGAGDPQVRRYLDEIESLRLDARTLAHDLSPAQFNWRPEPKRWSIGQCLEHLTLTVRLYPGRIERMLAESQQRQARGARPYREGLLARWVVHSMEPPPKIRTRTFGRVEPPTYLEPENVLRGFDAAHALLADLVRRADGLSLVHARTASPFLPILYFTLDQTIAMNLAHGRRHLWQARQIRGMPGFPPV